MSSILESEKHIPIVYDVDVAVAGAGVSGIFAALAAGRKGAKTVLIDRFGSPGGNLGPGYNMTGGGNLRFSSLPKLANFEQIQKNKYLAASGRGEYLLGGNADLPKEFVQRYVELGGAFPPLFKNYSLMRDSNIASYLSSKMLEETDVKMLLSTYIADPILEGNKVCGVFVENKSGRQSVKAKVVIDATGEADVARRAGAPVIYPKAEYWNLDHHAPTGMGIWGFIGGVDWCKYQSFLKEREPIPSNEDDLKWSNETLGKSLPSTLLPFARKAFERTGYKFVQEIGNLCKVSHRFEPNEYEKDGIVQVKIQLERPQSNVDAANGLHISKLEAGVRIYAFETVKFYKEFISGFEESYLLFVAPFFGSRGGPCIEGEYTLTMEDCMAGKRFDDVIYIYGEGHALKYTCRQGRCKWTDVPYRVMVPKKIDGLIATGRSASGKPDTLLRIKPAVVHMGVAGGIAASLAVKNNVEPRNLNIKELQKSLLDEGFYLGDKERLHELELDK